MKKARLSIMFLVAFNFSDLTFADAQLSEWMINTDGTTGSSPNRVLNDLASNILADVERVRYNDANVYVETSGVPSYPTGPFRNRNYAADLNAVYRIARNPTQNTGVLDEVGLGPIGVLVNGVVFFNYQDAFSYQDQDIWHQDANIFELRGFDDSYGHPARLRNGSSDQGFFQGRYHHHGAPDSLREQLNDDGSVHSPILGFAFDGFPVYGPYSYANSDGTGDIVRMQSSYRLRDIQDRTTLPDGAQLPPALHGPSLDANALGSYGEDYIYDPLHGNLDDLNGRFAVTPEYPEGTYAYYVTIDENNDPAFPYFIGHSYYGNVINQRNVQIPNSAVEYIPSETIAGDFNGDDVLDAIDIDALTQAIFENSNDTSFDVNSDDAIDQLDRDYWLAELKMIPVGDSNMDGTFNSNDLTQIFVAAQYEDGIERNSTWATGDWDGNLEFDTADLVAAFEAGTYSQTASPIAVPEPAANLALVLAVGCLLLMRKSLTVC